MPVPIHIRRRSRADHVDDLARMPEAGAICAECLQRRESDGKLNSFVLDGATRVTPIAELAGP